MRGDQRQRSTTSNTVAVIVAAQANANLSNSTASAGTAPVFTTRSVSQPIATGGSGTLTVATDSATAYQWYRVTTVHRAPLETERAAVSALPTAVQADNTLASSALLSGTFTDMVIKAV